MRTRNVLPPVLDYASETILRPRLSVQYAYVALIGFAMAAISLYVAVTGGPFHIMLLFFGTGIVILAIATVHLVPGSTCIRIGHAGFSVRDWWIESRHYRWDSIVRFDVVPIGKGNFGVHVVYQPNPKSARHLRKRHRRLAFMRRAAAIEKSEYIIDAESYGITAQEMAGVMEKYRQQMLNKH